MKKSLLFSAWILIILGVSAQTPKPLVITENTHFVVLPNDCDNISWLEDGIWSVERYNKFAFYNAQGKRIFDFEWEAGSGFRTPQMVGGAVLMYKKGEVNSQKPMWLLKSDGTSKALPAEYVGPATNFVDGVALIGKKKSSGYGVEYVYINLNGQRVYGTLTSSPERFERTNWTVPPLRDGLRAFKQLNPSGFGGKWGYIDANGKVVIPARYDECRSFSEGYALVREDRELYFIDKNGNKAIDPIWDDDTYFNDISDVHNGYFVVSYNPRKYFNTKGDLVKKLPGGSAFYNGYCFAEDETPYNGKSRVFDKDFNLVRTIPEVDLWWNDEGNAPIFTPAGVATVKRDRVISPDGITLIQHSSVTKKSPNRNGIEYFSPSGFAKAWLVHNGETYEGFINLNGEFVLIYRWNREVVPIVNDPNNPSPCDTCKIFPNPVR